MDMRRDELEWEMKEEMQKMRKEIQGLNEEMREMKGNTKKTMCFYNFSIV